MKGLYKFEKHFGRMGMLDGVFIADDSAVNEIVGTEVCFGEALGKHSEIECTIEDGDIWPVSDDQRIVDILEEKFPSGTVCGWNPLDYLDNE